MLGQDWILIASLSVESSVLVIARACPFSRTEWALGSLVCGAIVAVAWAGESAAVYLAAYLLVCWVNAAADCCGGVCLHVVSGFQTLCGYYRLTSACVCTG